MAMDSEEFKKLLEIIKNNTAPSLLDFKYKHLDEAQAIMLIDNLKTNISVHSLLLGRPCMKELGLSVMAALASLLSLNQCLQRLNLENNTINAKGIGLLASSIKSSCLKRLDLWDNQIGDDGMKLLAPTVKRLLCLNLARNEIGDEGMKLLVPVIQESHLQHLNLSENGKVGNEGMKLLAIAIKNSCLKMLELSSSQYVPADMNLLAPAIKDSLLEYLSLGWNLIGPAGIKILAPAIKESRLLFLNLGGNLIGDDGVKMIAPVIKSSQLLHLDLCRDGISDEGMKTLAPALEGSRLLHLNLGGNFIGDDGAKALGSAFKESRLQGLSLMENQIGDEGAKALSIGLKESRLQSLYLQNNKIGDENEALFQKLLAPRQMQAEILKREIQQNLDILEPKFKQLLRFSKMEVSLFSFSYASQCKTLYSQAKRLLQTWERLSCWQYAPHLNKATEHWQLLLCQCLDRLPEKEWDEIAALSFTLVEEDDNFLDSEQKETKESAEIKEISELTQTLSPKALSQLQQAFNTQEQQLSQHLQEQEKRLVQQIVQLETQLKAKTTEALETKLAQLRAEQIKLLERQLDFSLLMNQFDILNAKIKVPEKDLDKLKIQLQQKFNLLGQETIEARQQSQAQHRQAAEDLQKALLAQETALNTRIETLKAAVASGDSVKEKQLLQFQAEHQLLMEAHQAKQQLLAKRQYIEGHENLRLFYRSVQVKLQELFLAYKVLDSGMVQRAQYSTKDKIADGLQIAGEWIPLPYASEVVGLVSKFIQSRSDKEEARRAEVVAYTAMSFAEIDSISEETARQLTDRYEEQVHQLKPEGAKTLGECTLRYIIAYLAGNQLTADKPLPEQFLYSVLSLDVHNGWWPLTHKDIPVQAPASGWTDNGAFKHPGIKTEKGEFFSSEDSHKTKAHKYGYRLGTKAEALAAGLTQTAERVISKVPAQVDSKLTPAGHKQVAHVSAKADNLGERFELLQNQLRQEHDMRVKESEKLEKESKKNAELQAQMAAQGKEIEMLKQFMANFMASQSPKSPQSPSANDRSFNPSFPSS